MRKVLRLLYQPYKWLIFIPFFVMNTLAFGVVAVIFSIIFNQRTGSYFGGVLWSRLNSLFTPMFVTVTGKQNIKKDTSYIIIPNHQSYYDIFVVYGWLGMDIKWIMKKELKKIPGIGFGSQKVGHIFLDRSNSRVAVESLNEAKRKLVKGISVVIFPEGTRSQTGELGTFKRGAFKLAHELELPILPITIKGTKNILPADSIDLLPGKVQLIIHKPIEFEDYKNDDINQIMNRVREVILSGL